MPNPQTPAPNTAKPSGSDEPTIVDDKGLTQSQTNASGSQSQRQSTDKRPSDKGSGEKDGGPDQVEIGDPVPEDERTVRADDDADEDLPGADDDGGRSTTEDDSSGSNSERH
jgi:hypothetical protein